MTLVQPPVMVHGGSHSARAMRLMIAGLAHGRQGIVAAGDLKVRPLEAPDSGVRIADGAAIIRGARPWQGAYSQTNAGDTTVQVPPTGPFARTDLLVLRIEDPEYEGHRDPCREDLGYFHLITDVDEGESVVPRGMTAIPLARLTLPRNTSAITAGMVTDLRQPAHPRTARALHTSHPDTRQKLPGRHGKWTDWPAEASWKVDVPEWATKAAIVVTASGLRMQGGSLYAQLRACLGDKKHTASTTLDDDQGDTARRTTVVLAGSVTLPADYRGTSQRLFLQANRNDRYGGGQLSAAEGTTVTADIEFSEGPV